MLPPKVRRSTMAAQSLGLVKVSVQPLELLTVSGGGHSFRPPLPSPKTDDRISVRPVTST